MDRYPIVTILLITYKRLTLAIDTVQHLIEKLDYPNLGFHIADSGSGETYQTALREAIGPNYHTTLSTPPTPNVGANMNLGSKAALERGDFVLHIEDDWRLREVFDLKPCVEILTTDETVGMVRLGYMSAGLKAEVMAAAGHLWWRIWKNPDFVYNFSGHPALRHRRWFDAYMPYREDQSIGHTELGMCANFNSRPGPDIVMPAWTGDQQIFLHTGDHQSIKWQEDAGEELGYE